MGKNKRIQNIVSVQSKLFFSDKLSWGRRIFKEGSIKISNPDHPINVDAEKSGGPARENVTCFELEHSGKFLFVAHIQAYCNKSEMTLSRVSVYPLPLILLNITYSGRERLIRSGSTVVVYLPVSASIDRRGSRVGFLSDPRYNATTTRVKTLRTLHDYIFYFAQSLFEDVLMGIQCLPRDDIFNVILFLHGMLETFQSLRTSLRSTMRIVQLTVALYVRYRKRSNSKGERTR